MTIVIEVLDKRGNLIVQSARLAVTPAIDDSIQVKGIESSEDCTLTVQANCRDCRRSYQLVQTQLRGCKIRRNSRSAASSAVTVPYEIVSKECKLCNPDSDSDDEEELFEYDSETGEYICEPGTTADQASGLVERLRQHGL